MIIARYATILNKIHRIGSVFLLRIEYNVVRKQKGGFYDEKILYEMEMVAYC